MALAQRTVTQTNGRANVEGFQDRFNKIANNVSGVVVTSEKNIHLALLGLFAQGHVLLEDLPGVGKTLLAKTIADSIEGKFSRIQFTSDLLPTDITGTSVFDMQNQTFEFVPGPIFANVVVADELNRAGPRTQGALLEAMAESQISADGKRWELPRPFLIVATQNLVESHGTYPLPNSQLDRFLISMSLGLPNREQELEILYRSQHGAIRVSPVATADEIVAMQETALNVEVSHPIKEYIVNLATATRENEDFIVGVSPRGSAALVRGCQAWAAISGRDFVVPEDVQELAPYIWGHRITARPEAEFSSGSEAITRILKSVPVPL
ncbi:MAG: MoxR family ATPase [SAR202 cluster bacterium]|nr:MoxR family ATPase [SAR202 cluster bacterium]